MTKVKFFKGESQTDLEKQINEFIAGKTIINISYAINPDNIVGKHCCVVLYQSW